MAYDDYLADRIQQQFKEKSVAFIEKPMMGGLCYMVYRLKDRSLVV